MFTLAIWLLPVFLGAIQCAILRAKSANGKNMLAGVGLLVSILGVILHVCRLFRLI